MQSEFNPNLLICNGVRKIHYTYWGKTSSRSFYNVGPLRPSQIEDR